MNSFDPHSPSIWLLAAVCLVLMAICLYYHGRNAGRAVTYILTPPPRPIDNSNNAPVGCLALLALVAIAVGFCVGLALLNG